MLVIMMGKIHAIKWTFLSHCISEGVFVDGACPSSQAEAEAKAKNCLKRIGVDIDAAGAGGSMANNDMDQLKQYCK